MIPYDIDPSLHAAKPERNRLDDGCTPLRRQGESPMPASADFAFSLEEVLAVKSDF